MQHPRKKMTRRELKQDKFITATIRAKDFLEKNSKLVIRAILGIIIIAVVVVFFVRSKHEANLNAATMLSRAQSLLNSDKQQVAQDTLNLLIDRYDGTSAAGRATFLLAKIYWEKNDFENAKIYFQKYIDEYMDNTVVSQSALAGYADCLIHENMYDEAAKYYEKASKVNHDFPETPSFLLSAATAYKEAGKFDKAEELAQKIIDDYTDVQIKNKAEILLQNLKYAKS